MKKRILIITAMILISGFSIILGKIVLNPKREAPYFGDFLKGYRDAVCNRENPYEHGFVYPPPAAFLILPFCLIPAKTGAMIFVILNTFSIILASYLLISRKFSKKLAFTGAFILLLWYPAYNTLAFGQINGIVLLLTTLGVLTANDVLSGFLLGAATAIKIWPALLPFSRSKKAIFSFAIFLALVSLLSIMLLPKVSWKEFIKAQIRYNSPKIPKFGQIRSAFEKMNPNWSTTQEVLLLTKSYVLANFARLLLTLLALSFVRRKPLLWFSLLPFLVTFSLHTHHMLFLLLPALAYIESYLKHVEFYLFIFFSSFNLHIYYLTYLLGVPLLPRIIPPLFLAFLFFLIASVKISLKD